MSEKLAAALLRHLTKAQRATMRCVPIAVYDTHPLLGYEFPGFELDIPELHH